MIVLPGTTDITTAAQRKRRPNVVTSFNEAGYERYGRKFIETFLQYWPASIRLTVYYEGENFDFTNGVSWHPIETVGYIKDFMENLRFPIMHGIVGNQYDILFDARHARKAFIEMHAMKTYGGKVFWLDADTVTHSNVPENFLDEWLPDDAFCAYLGREGWYYSETSFIGFNGNHPIASRFSKNYLHTFLSGVFLTIQDPYLGRPGWVDCHGFDAIRNVLGNGPEFVDHSKGLPHGTMHPFVNTRAGAYMDHMKGKRKDTGGTKQSDLVIQRDEDYWKKQA